MFPVHATCYVAALSAVKKLQRRLLTEIRLATSFSSTNAAAISFSILPQTHLRNFKTAKDKSYCKLLKL